MPDPVETKPTTPYREGFKAFAGKVPQSQNPYVPGDNSDEPDDAYEWYRGYEDNRRRQKVYGKSLMTTPEIVKIVHLSKKAKSVLEIGTASGVTATRIAEALPEAYVIQVDTFGDTDHPNVRREDPERVWNAVGNLRPNQGLWAGNLASFVRISHVVFDVIIIDGDHSFAGVLSDLRLSEKILDPSGLGLIILHGYTEPNWPDIATATAKFLTESTFKLKEQHGRLAVLRKG